MSKATQFMIHTFQSSGCKKNCSNKLSVGVRAREGERESDAMGKRAIGKCFEERAAV